MFQGAKGVKEQSVLRSKVFQGAKGVKKAVKVVKVVKVRYQNVWVRRLLRVSVGKFEVMTSCDNESDLISSSHIIIWVLHTR